MEVEYINIFRKCLHKKLQKDLKVDVHTFTHFDQDIYVCFYENNNEIFRYTLKGADVAIQNGLSSNDLAINILKIFKNKINKKSFK